MQVYTSRNAKVVKPVHKCTLIYAVKRKKSDFRSRQHSDRFHRPRSSFDIRLLLIVVIKFVNIFIIEIMQT